jgi:hypothetical protein
MLEALERGDIHFLYRPRVEHAHVEAPEDVQRLHIVLHPRGGGFRRLIVGRKRLPKAEPPAQERFWAFVDATAARGREIADRLGTERYQTATRGERTQPAARPLAEGVYAIIRHDDHTHLVHELELPRDSGEPQEELGIEPQASYIVAVKNPEATSPPGVGFSRPPKLPEQLLERFRGRRFAPLDPPDFLDHEGVELLLIGASEHPRDELGIELEPERESRHTADLFRQLQLDPEETPAAPMLRREWE